MATKFPLAVEIEINSDCNMACPYCPNSKAERVEKGRMEKSLFIEILNQLKSIEYNGRISYHFYNEPTLSPDLEEFVSLTKEYLPNARIDLFSNATLLDKNKIATKIKIFILLKLAEIERVKKAEKDQHFSEDERKHAEGEIQKLTDKHIKEIDLLVVQKEKEIMEV